MPKAVKGTPGMSLRSLHMDAAAGEASMVIMAEDYAMVRSQLAGQPLRHRTQGKALSVFEGAADGACGEQLFRFASGLPFNTEEAQDVCEFLALEDKPFSVDSVELSGTSFSLKAHAELAGAANTETDETAAAASESVSIAAESAVVAHEEDPAASEASVAKAEAYYDRLSELIARYQMGVIKTGG